MNNIPFSELVEQQMHIAKMNFKPELKYAIADASIGVAGAIYKRSTEEVDFISISSSSRTENDLGDFVYGLAGIEDGEKVLLAAEEDGTNAYLKGMDVRLVGRELTEEERPNFEEEGHEIFDINTLHEMESRVDKLFDDYRDSGEVKTFQIDGGSFEEFLFQLMRVRPIKDWMTAGLVHFQPQWTHNPAQNEYLARLYFDGEFYTANVPVVRNNQMAVETFDVDMTKSRQLSLECPTDEDFAEYENGIPVFGSLTKTSVEENGKMVTIDVFLVKRAFRRGVRMAGQYVGPSGIRLPIAEKHYRPVTVTANKAHHVLPETVRDVPFYTPAKITNAIPFTLGVDDVIRLSRLFQPGDIVDVTYISTLDRNGILPVKFEMHTEYPEKDSTGRKHFDRKVALVASILPLVNGKVIVQ